MSLIIVKKIQQFKNYVKHLRNLRIIFFNIVSSKNDTIHSFAFVSMKESIRNVMCGIRNGIWVTYFWDTSGIHY